MLQKWQKNALFFEDESGIICNIKYTKGKYHMKRIFSFVLVLLVLFSSFAFADEMTQIKDTSKNQIKLKDSYPDNPYVVGYSSTTGLPASGEDYTPILIVLDNAEAAYPHFGVSQADILFQVPNAGAGATKLMALFADQYPEMSGGVRSVRASMVPIAKAWDAAICYVGGPDLDSDNADPFGLINKFDMKANRSFNLQSAYTHRVNFHDKPHNAACHVREIHEKLVNDNVIFEERPFLFADEPRTDGEQAEFVKVIHRGDDASNRSNPASEATFAYNPELSAYVRTNSSGEYVDYDTGEIVPFANVIVLRTTFGWNYNYVFLKDHLVGDGVVEVFQNGKYVRGAWYRKSQNDRLVFVGPDGEELPMQRGKTFVVVTNAVTDVSYR